MSVNTNSLDRVCKCARRAHNESSSPNGPSTKPPQKIVKGQCKGFRVSRTVRYGAVAVVLCSNATSGDAARMLVFLGMKISDPLLPELPNYLSFIFFLGLGLGLG